jgi:hypothetical protein
MDLLADILRAFSLFCLARALCDIALPLGKLVMPPFGGLSAILHRKVALTLLYRKVLFRDRLGNNSVYHVEDIDTQLLIGARRNS